MQVETKKNVFQNAHGEMKIEEWRKKEVIRKRKATTGHVCSGSFFNQMLTSHSAFDAHMCLNKSRRKKSTKSNIVITLKEYANKGLKISF